MGEVGIVPPQVRQDNPLPSEQVTGDLTEELVLLVHGSLCVFQPKWVDDLAGAPETAFEVAGDSRVAHGVIEGTLIVNIALLTDPVGDYIVDAEDPRIEPDYTEIEDVLNQIG